MPDDVTKLDYDTPRPAGRSAVATARIAIVAVGVALPYLSRIPGMFVHGPEWLTSYLEPGIAGFLFIGAFNAVNWGTIVLGTLLLQRVRAVAAAAVVGFAFPAFMHGTLDLASDAQAAIALIFIPLYSVPLVGLGLLVGIGVDVACQRRQRRQRRQSSSHETDPGGTR